MLTSGELRIMKVLWRRNTATAREVLDELAGTHNLAYTTVQTMLNILERKGFVAVDKTARAHRFSPLLKRGKAQAMAVRELIDQFFDRSDKALAQHIIDNGELDPLELESLHALIEEQKND